LLRRGDQDGAAGCGPHRRRQDRRHPGGRRLEVPVVAALDDRLRGSSRRPRQQGLVVAGMPLTLPTAMVAEMIDHARAEVPDEACGVIGGADGVAKRLIRATNAEHSPFRYSIAPREILRILDDLDEIGAEIMVIYHSHTHTPAYPSPTDVAFSGGFPDA